jgi:uncharacterized protein (TIGR03437 family)
VLGGTRVSLHGSDSSDQPAQLLFVSPGQINFIVPSAVAKGPATLRVTRDAAAGPARLVGATGVLVSAVMPGIFTANANGSGVPAAFAIRTGADGSQVTVPVYQCGSTPGSCAPAPIDLGGPADDVVLVLYGTGIQGVSSASGVNVRINGVSADVLYVGPQGSFAGLDQLNVRIPRGLTGRGNVDVAIIVDGVSANPVIIGVR